jgi:ribosomal protein L40E
MDPKKCLNCDAPLPEKAKFCPSCGQKNNNGKVRMKELLREFWHHFSHVDNKFLKAIWQLFFPARVTIEYFKGKHKQYPQPVQFFFVVMFFFFLFLNRSHFLNKVHYANINGHFGLTLGPNAQNLLTSDDIRRNSILQSVDQTLRTKYESLPPEVKSEEAGVVMDTVLETIDGQIKHFGDLPAKTSGGRSDLQDSVRLETFNNSIRLSVSDVMNLEPEQILEKYQVKNWVDRILFNQGIKSFKNPEGLLHLYIGSAAWSILVLIAGMSGMLALLYWKQKRYYVEHFIFLMHQHSAAFMGMTLLMIVGFFIDLGYWWLLVFPWITIYLLLAMRNYYGQGWGWTILKWLAYLALYLTGFIAILILSLMIVFIIF